MLLSEEMLVPAQTEVVLLQAEMQSVLCDGANMCGTDVCGTRRYADSECGPGTGGRGTTQAERIESVGRRSEEVSRPL